MHFLSLLFVICLSLPSRASDDDAAAYDRAKNFAINVAGGRILVAVSGPRGGQLAPEKGARVAADEMLKSVDASSVEYEVKSKSRLLACTVNVYLVNLNK